MQKLKSEGKASSKAVDFAILQLALAQAQVASATIAATSATAGAAAAAETSIGTGFYGAAYINTTATGIKTPTPLQPHKAQAWLLVEALTSTPIKISI